MGKLNLLVNVGPFGEIEDKSGNLLWRVVLDGEGIELTFIPFCAPDMFKVFQNKGEHIDRVLMFYDKFPDECKFARASKSKKDLNVLCTKAVFEKLIDKADNVMVTIVCTYTKYEYGSTVDVLDLFKKDFKLVDREFERSTIMMPIYKSIEGWTECLFIREKYERRQ